MPRKRKSPVVPMSAAAIAAAVAATYRTLTPAQAIALRAANRLAPARDHAAAHGSGEFVFAPAGNGVRRLYRLIPAIAAAFLSIAAPDAARAEEPGFAFLATAYTSDGPAAFVIANGVSGPDCIAALELGVTPTLALAILAGDIAPAPEAHVPAAAEIPPLVDSLVLSCELAW